MSTLFWLWHKKLSFILKKRVLILFRLTIVFIFCCDEWIILGRFVFFIQSGNVVCIVTECSHIYWAYRITFCIWTSIRIWAFSTLSCLHHSVRRLNITHKLESFVIVRWLYMTHWLIYLWKTLWLNESKLLLNVLHLLLELLNLCFMIDVNAFFLKKKFFCLQQTFFRFLHILFDSWKIRFYWTAWGLLSYILNFINLLFRCIISHILMMTFIT